MIEAENPNGDAAVELVGPDGLIRRLGRVQALRPPARRAPACQGASPGFPKSPHQHTFLGNQTLDRSHVAGGNSGRGCIALDRSLGCTEGEDWLAAGMLVTERAVPKPHPRYVAMAAIEIGNSGIGPRASPLGRAIPPKSMLVCNPSASAGLILHAVLIGDARPLVT